MHFLKVSLNPLRSYNIGVGELLILGFLSLQRPQNHETVPTLPKRGSDRVPLLLSL